MSKIYNHYLKLKQEGGETLYLFQSGIFYLFIDEDAKKVAELLGLKLVPLNESIVKCGFPASSLNKYTCLPEKGTHHAAQKVQQYMRICHRKYDRFWVLKCDIKKFFYRIHKMTLWNIMQKYIEDKILLHFTHQLIFDSEEDVGIPIGNYTSQYFANIYLNELDQYIKRELHVSYYVRYMDDFVLLLKTKRECVQLKEKIEIFLREKLRLELNEKTKYYPYQMGVNFCGYRIYTTHMLLRKSSKEKIKRNIKKWNKLYEAHKLNFKKLQMQYTSWLGHAKHCNSYHFIHHIEDKGKFFYHEKD